MRILPKSTFRYPEGKFLPHPENHIVPIVIWPQAIRMSISDPKKPKISPTLYICSISAAPAYHVSISIPDYLPTVHPSEFRPARAKAQGHRPQAEAVGGHHNSGHDPGDWRFFSIPDGRLCHSARNCDQTGKFNWMGEARKDDRDGPTTTVGDIRRVRSGYQNHGKRRSNPKIGRAHV